MPLISRARSSFWAKILQWMGWKALVPLERPDKSIICVAPHTSNKDFFIGLIYYLAYSGFPNFLIKKEWFVFPFSLFFKAMGGVPVDRKQSGSMVKSMIERFTQNSRLRLAITPEGTRSYTEKWKTGFLRIAIGAGIPIELAKLDVRTKEVGIFELFYPTGDIEADLQTIRSYYRKEMAINPENFHDIHQE